MISIRIWLFKIINRLFPDADANYHANADFIRTRNTTAKVRAANEAVRKFRIGCEEWKPNALMGHAYLAGFFAGADWNEHHDCPNQQQTPVEQCSHEDCQKPVNGELEGDD